MTFLNPVASWALLPLVAAIVWLAWRTYAAAPVVPARRGILATLRGMTLLAIAFFLLRPALVRPQAPSGTVVPVLIDASRSMGIRDRGPDGAPRPSSRFDEAVALARGPLARALAAYRVELLELRDENVSPLDAGRPASGNQSDLASAIAAVRERYRGRSVGGIVLLSDGADTGGGALEDGEPATFAIPIGAAMSPRDQEVLSLALDPEALPGSSVDLTATIVSHGYGTQPMDVRLLAGDRPVEIRRVNPAVEGLPVQVRFELPPAGEQPVVYTVDLPRRGDEAVGQNNARRAILQPIGRKRRVLFVQGAPGYEHGFLARAWSNDPYVELDAVVRKGQNDKGSATFYVQAGSRATSLASGMPAGRAPLFAYDAIVVGNATRDLLSDAQIELLDSFVAERGGGVLVLGGRSFAADGLAAGALRPLLPVGAGAALDAARASVGAGVTNKLQLTRDGERHPVLRLRGAREESPARWREAPALAGVAPLGAIRPGAQVLATATAGGAARPLLVVQRYGEGRAMVFAGEASWRWKMQRPVNDRLYDTFWQQAVRWLSAPAPDPVAMDVELEPQPGQETTIGVTVRNDAFEPIRDAAVEIVVRGEAGGQDVLRASLTDSTRGRYTATWVPRAAGVFRVTASARRASSRITAAERHVLVGGADHETADPRRREDVLSRLAVRGGGAVFAPSQVQELAAAVRARPHAAPAPAVRELWHGPWTFMLLVALLAVEWSLRRRWGLR